MLVILIPIETMDLLICHHIYIDVDADVKKGEDDPYAYLGYYG